MRYSRNFWENIDIKEQDGCWEWTGKIGANGYGYLWIGGKWKLAHRIAFSSIEELNTKHELMHLCDNPKCCNPKHLAQVSHKENMLDSIKKGRFKLPPANSSVLRGEQNGMSKITKDQVIVIKKLLKTKSCKDVSSIVGINLSTIYHIYYENSWKWLS